MRGGGYRFVFVWTSQTDFPYPGGAVRPFISIFIHHFLIAKNPPSRTSSAAPVNHHPASHLLLLASCFLLLGAIHTFQSLSQTLPLQVYTSRDGLLSIGVTALFQDARGFLWIGTSEGLVEYDGITFTTFRTTEGLTDDYVTAVSEDPAAPGILWIGTGSGGVNVLRAGAFHEMMLDTLTGSRSVADVRTDGRGRIWCLTEAGVYVIDHGRVARWLGNPESGVEMNLAICRDGRGWVSEGHVLHIDDGSDRRIIDLERLIPGHAFVHCLSAGRDSSMYIGTSDGSVLQFRNGTMIRRWRVPGTHAESIICDEDGTVWLTTNLGLVSLTGGTKAWAPPRRVSTANGLPSNDISCGLIDSEGNLWLGTRKGLVKWANRRFVRFPITPLEAGTVAAPPAAMDGRGHVWMAAGDGIMEFWNNPESGWRSRLHRYGHESAGEQPRCVTFDSRGNIWIGTVKGRLQAFALKGRADQTALVSLPGLRIDAQFTRPGFQTFIVDRRGRVWCSIQDRGIVVFSPGHHPKVLARYGLTEGLPDLSVRAMYEDSRGRIWFGGYGNGLACTDSVEFPARLRRFSRNEGLPDGHVRAIYEDQSGALWIGTRESGVARYANGSFDVLSIQDGLISNTVWSIAGDEGGRILAGTAMGLQTIDLQTLKPSIAVSESRGLPIHACGAWKSEYFWTASTSQEFAASESEPSVVQAVTPPVYITTVEVNGGKVSPEGSLSLRYDQNTLSIGFVGISFRDENAVRYLYRLLDVSPQWGEPSNEHAVTYSELQPGAYRFEVRAMDRNGVVSATPAAFVFTIVPPLWQKLWFRALILCVLGAALLSIYRVRVNKLLEVEKTRTQIARDLHDEISGAVSGIANFAQAIRRDAANRFTTPSQKFLSLISDSAEEVQDSLGDIIWSLNPENDPWDAMLPKLRRFASDLFESQRIHYTIDIPRTLPVKTLDTQRRRDLWLVFKEMVTNSVKHSECSMAEVSVTATDDRKIRIIVQDNGKGFDPSDFTGRHGLRNIEARARSLKATVNLRTAPGLGTRWELTISV